MLVCMRLNPRFTERMRAEEGCISREENKRRRRSEDAKRNICCSCCHGSNGTVPDPGQEHSGSPLSPAFAVLLGPPSSAPAPATPILAQISRQTSSAHTAAGADGWTLPFDAGGEGGSTASGAPVLRRSSSGAGRTRPCSGRPCRVLLTRPTRPSQAGLDLPMSGPRVPPASQSPGKGGCREAQQRTGSLNAAAEPWLGALSTCPPRCLSAPEVRISPSSQRYS